MNDTAYIFDVDGTLTPSRGKMDYEFKAFFNTFCLVNDVYLVTGSDRAKTIEQLTEPTYNLAKRVYNCSGNEVYCQDLQVKSRDWSAPKELVELMHGWLQASSFPLRTGNHIELRPGCLNFSIVGREATLGERNLYIKHDLDNRERESIAHQINLNFSDITATVGGETGIDISPTGWDKSQIIDDFATYNKLVFFGDKTEPGGNDHSLAKAITDNHRGKVNQVKDWKETYSLLK